MSCQQLAADQPPALDASSWHCLVSAVQHPQLYHPRPPAGQASGLWAMAQQGIVQAARTL